MVEIGYQSLVKWTHANADMMSRLPCDDESDVSDTDKMYSIQVATLPVTADELKYEIENDVILTQVKQCLQRGKWPEVTDQLRPYFIRRDEFSIENDIILLGLKMVIPRSLRKRILHELHHQHPGIVKMKAIGRMHVWYPGIDADIETVVKECETCLNVANERPKSVIHPWSWPVKAMDRIHVDFF